MAWPSPYDDGVKLAGCSPCGWLSTSQYCLGVVPLQGLITAPCDDAEWLVTAVRVQNVVLPLLWYDSGSPSVVE